RFSCEVILLFATCRAKISAVAGRSIDIAREIRRAVFGQALEQGIALKLILHIARQVQIGELQQLDRLHQLRRHHQGMALAKLKSRAKGHDGYRISPGPDLARFLAVGPILAYPVLEPLYTTASRRP